METKEQNTKIATEILKQIGGVNRLIAMVNAKHMMVIENGLSFKFSGSKKANYVKIELNAMDTYDIEFGKIKGLDYTITETRAFAYNDQLVTIFESVTGLDLSL